MKRFFNAFQLILTGGKKRFTQVVSGALSPTVVAETILETRPTTGTATIVLPHQSGEIAVTDLKDARVGERVAVFNANKDLKEDTLITVTELQTLDNIQSNVQLQLDDKTSFLYADNHVGGENFTLGVPIIDDVITWNGLEFELSPKSGSDLVNYLRRDGLNTITGSIDPQDDALQSLGSVTKRFAQVVSNETRTDIITTPPGTGDVQVLRPLDISNQVIKNVADPINLQEAATKNYVDTQDTSILTQANAYTDAEIFALDPAPDSATYTDITSPIIVSTNNKNSIAILSPPAINPIDPNFLIQPGSGDTFFPYEFFYNKAKEEYIIVGECSTEKILVNPNNFSSLFDEIAQPNNFVHFSIAYSPRLNTYVAAGAGLSSGSSLAALTSRTYPNPSSVISVIWVERLSLFLAVTVGITNTVPSQIISSPDGTTWTTRLNLGLDFTGRVRSIIDDGVNLLAITSRPSDFVFQSPDGINWTDLNLNGPVTMTLNPNSTKQSKAIYFPDRDGYIFGLYTSSGVDRDKIYFTKDFKTYELLADNFLHHDMQYVEETKSVLISGIRDSRPLILNVTNSGVSNLFTTNSFNSVPICGYNKKNESIYFLFSQTVGYDLYEIPLNIFNGIQTTDVPQNKIVTLINSNQSTPILIKNLSNVRLEQTIYLNYNLPVDLIYNDGVFRKKN